MEDSRRMNASFRLIAEDGTPLPSMLHAETVRIVEGNRVWETNAIEERLAELNPPSRDFVIRDGPKWQSMSPCLHG
jgi:hypothetical protein